MATTIGTSTTAGAAGNSVVCNVPTGNPVGTVLVATASTYGVSTATVSVPSGWTRVGVQYDDNDDGADCLHLSMMTHVVAGGDPTTVTFTGTGTIIAVAAVIQGYALTLPVVSSAGGKESTSLSTHTVSSVTTTATDQAIIAGFATYYGSTHSWTAGSGFVSRGNPKVADDLSLMMEDRLTVTVGSISPTGVGAKSTSAVAMMALLANPVAGLSGTGTISQTHTLVSTGSKGVSGTGTVINQTHTLIAVSAKVSSGTGAITQSSTLTPGNGYGDGLYDEGLFGGTPSGYKIGISTGAISQTSTLTSTGASGGLGVAIITQTHSVTSTGTKSTAGTGAIAETHSLASTGTKSASGTGAIAETHSVVSTGTSSVSGTGAISQTHTLDCVSGKVSEGTGAIAETHSVTSTGIKAPTGTGEIAETHSVFSTDGTRSTSGTGTSIDQTHALTAVSGKIIEGTGAISQTYTLTCTSLKIGSGTGAIAETHSLFSTGAELSIGTGVITQTHTLDSTGAKTDTNGTGVISQTHTVEGQGAGFVAGVGMVNILQGNDLTSTGFKSGLGTSLIAETHSLTSTGIKQAGQIVNLLIHNPGAEIAGGWSTNNASFYTQAFDSTYARSGTRSSKGTTVSVTTAICSAYDLGYIGVLPVTAGQILMFSLWTSTAVASASAQVSLAFYTGATSIPGSTVYATATPINTTTGVWTENVVWAVVPVGADGVRNSVAILKTSPTAGMTAWLDDALMTRNNTLLQTSTITSTGNKSGSGTAAISQTNGLYGRSAQMVTNQLTSTATTYYGGPGGTGGSATMAVSLTGGPTNGPYVRLTWTAPQTVGPGNSGLQYSTGSIDPYMTVYPGEKVVASVWVRTSIAQRVALYVQYIAEAALGGSTLLSQSPQLVLVANTWTLFELTASAALVAPAGTVRVRLLAYGIAGTGAVNWATGNTLDVAPFSAFIAIIASGTGAISQTSTLTSTGFKTAWSSPNLYPNPGAEETTGSNVYWLMNTSSATRTYDTTQTHSGNYAALGTVTISNQIYVTTLYGPILTVPSNGRTYTFSMWAYTPDSNLIFQLMYQQLTAGVHGGYTYAAAAPGQIALTPGVWTEAHVTFTLPAGVDQLRLFSNVYVSGGSTNSSVGMKAWLDDALLIEQITSGTISQTHTLTSSSFKTAIGTGRVTSPVVTSLLTNPSFETGTTTGWSPTSATSTVINDGVTGSRALQLSAGAVGTARLEVLTAALSPGVYNLSIYWRTDAVVAPVPSSSFGTVVAAVANTTLTVGLTSTTTTNAVIGAWNRINTVFTVPAGADITVKGRWYIGGNTVTFDAAELVAGSLPSDPYSIVSTGNKIALSTSLITQTHTITSTGDRSSDGTGLIEQDSDLTSSGFSDLSGTGELEASCEITSAGLKQATGTGELSQSSFLTSTGEESAYGVGSIEQTHDLTSVGEKNAVSTGSIAQPSTLDSAGEKHPTGTGLIEQTCTVTAGIGTADRTGTGDLPVPVNLIGTGIKATAGTSELEQNVFISALGENNAYGVGFINQSQKLTSTGTMTGDSTGLISLDEPELQGFGEKIGRGTGLIEVPVEIAGEGSGLILRDGTGAIAQACLLTAIGTGYHLDWVMIKGDLRPATVSFKTSAGVFPATLTIK